MNKFKVLGVAQMVSIIVAIAAAHNLGFTSGAWAGQSTTHMVLWIAGLCIILFGSLSALTIDKK